MNVKHRLISARIIIFILLLATKNIIAQSSVGTSGLLNIPNGEIFADKTFSAGINYLPLGISGDIFTYNTGNYFFTLVFLPNLEVTYRMTLLKENSKIFNEQDRSFGFKFRIIKERKYTPSLVIGMSDIYTSSERGANRYFTSSYIVSDKNFETGLLKHRITFGYGFSAELIYRLTGFWGGYTLEHKLLPRFSFTNEYDTKNVNTALHYRAFNNIYSYIGMYGNYKIAAGISFRKVL